jgi:hypothetical protein
MVRDVVWSIRWSPRRGLASCTFDTIAIDNFIEQGGERFADLPRRGSAWPTMQSTTSQHRDDPADYGAPIAEFQAFCGEVEASSVVDLGLAVVA